MVVMPMRSGLYLPLSDELAHPAIVAPPGLGAPALNWMHSRGWQLHPQTAMPRRSRTAAALSHVTLSILHRSSSQAVFCGRCGASAGTGLNPPRMAHQYCDDGDFYCADCQQAGASGRTAGPAVPPSSQRAMLR